MKVLVRTFGYFGDIAFASSLAEYLKKEYKVVDYGIGFPQMETLISNNPFIDDVFVSEIPGPQVRLRQDILNGYDKVIDLDRLSFEVPPVVEFKAQAGIDDTSASYKLYTNPEYDKKVLQLFKQLPPNKKVIGVMSNWEERSFLFTEEQYKAGIDIPNKGYGGANRDIDKILLELEKEFTILQLGVKGSSQHQTLNIGDNQSKSILFEASIMKYCDAFVGAEGGLCNLAAGVGTKTIITGDFVHQLYGWNGVIRNMKEPKLGPKYYFTDQEHITLDPYLTDEQVINQIKSLV